MKQNISLKRSLILVLILALILSTAPLAFASTEDKWTTMAPMSTPRYYFQTEVVNGKIYAIGGLNDGGSLSSVEEYNPSTNLWTTKASMSTPRYGFQTEVIDGKIYAIGGIVNSKKTCTSSVEEYDPAMNTWTKKAPMSSMRSYLQTEVIDGKIYALGGYNGAVIANNGALSLVEVYDPATDEWTTKAPMSTARYDLQTEVVNGKIYAIGGYGHNGSGTSALSSVEAYDPAMNKWTTMASMNSVREVFQSGVIGGKIYAIGDTFSNNIEEYDPTLDKWTKKAAMSTARSNFQTEIVNGKIYAIGGKDLSSVEQYDPATDVWAPKASMTSPRLAFQTELINGKIYAIGGYGGSNGKLSSVEEYTVVQTDPTLTVTASSNNVKVGQQFTTAVAIHNVTNICAEDIKITYDPSLFIYAGVEAQPGLKIYEADTSTAGTVRFICACEGKDNAATGDKDLLTLKFTAKKAGIGKVDIIKGRIADNATLEEDVTDANCGEDTITVEGYTDVNKTGDFTLLDLGIDGWYYGMDAADTDTAKFNADVVTDGKIDDHDLTAITQCILANSNYSPNNK